MADDLATPFDAAPLDGLLEAEADKPLPETPAADPAAPVRLYLVDGSGYIFRAFHALPPLSRKSDGLPVGAVSGFCNMLWKFLGDMKSGGHDLKGPTHLAVVFDKSERTFRKDISADYKAHRPPPPDDLVPQFPLVREATRAFGVPALELEGYEADDLIATYARQCAATGGEVVIVSSDKDLMQLVNEQICMLDPVKDKRICAPEVFEKFGVTPDKVIDVQALAGDSVDNVPGRPRHRHQDRRPADHRVRRPRHAVGARGRDQAAQAPRDPDQLRRADPRLARAGDLGRRRAAAGPHLRAGRARLPRGGAPRLSGVHGVQGAWPGASPTVAARTARPPRRTRAATPTAAAPPPRATTR